MTKLTWVVENFATDSNNNRLKKSIEQAGYGLICIDKYPFNNKKYHDLGDYDNVIFYGSLNLASHLGKEKHWTPGVFGDFADFQCTHYYAKLGKYLLNQNYTMVPFAEFKRLRDKLFGQYGRDGQLFVRPSSGMKTFTGQLVSQNDWDKDIENIDFHGPNSYDMVIVAEPQSIFREWRGIIADKKIITICQYKEHGILKEQYCAPLKVFEFAEEIAKGDFQPDRVWVADFCETYDHNIHLLEIGAFSCSGLYHNNTDIIVREISIIAKDMYDEVYKI